MNTKIAISTLLLFFSQNIFAENIVNPITNESIESKKIVVTYEKLKNIDEKKIEFSTVTYNAAKIENNKIILHIPMDEYRPITALLLDDNDEPLGVVGYLPIETYLTHKEINATTTGVGLIWNFLISFNDNIKNSELEEKIRILNEMYKNQELIILGDFIYKKLSEDKEYLAKFDLYSESVYKNAVKAVDQIIIK